MGICPMCKKHKIKGDPNLIYENESLVVSHGPLESQILGYIYIEPKRHVENWYELSDLEMNEMGKILRIISRVLKEELNADRVYTVTISEVIRHLHIHIIPRISGKELKGVSLIEKATKSMKSEKNITSQEINEFIEILKNKCNENI
ncbi:HIT family protein [Niallia circulans]|uniref:HIT family protein n=1 Tax=Niallia circulans TaxID=1397 RepID=UPI0002F65C3B|nr:HIT family protein [Niallia circulans]